MDSDALKAAFKQAAEIANTVPEPLREAAFNRALDAILDNSVPPRRSGHSSAEATTRRKPAPQKQKEPGVAASNPFEHLTTHLDRTAHPEISSAPRVLERALCLLRVARDSYNIDGLGPTHIAKLLTEKFRLHTTKQAVQQALDPARDYVDRHSPQSGRIVYRIMRGGELYLDSRGSKEEKSAAAVRIVRTPKGAKKRTQAGKENKTSSATTARPAAKASSTKGTTAIVSGLISDGFFKSPRTIRSLIEHAKGTLGYHLKPNELSPPLLRALRSGKLKRAQNSEQQYEYSEA
jgi:hypothetical protein